MTSETKELTEHQRINLDYRDFRNKPDYHVDPWQEFVVKVLGLPSDTTFVTLWVQTVDYSNLIT